MSVPTLPGSETCQSASPTAAWLGALAEPVAPEDGDHPRRMRELGDVRQQLRLDVDAGREHVLRLEPGVEPGLDEILALDDEQPQPPALRAGAQPPDELEPRVGGRGDHGRDV